jgi:hypothetical protein
MSSSWLPENGVQADNQQAANNVWDIYPETKERVVPSLQVSLPTT